MERIKIAGLEVQIEPNAAGTFDVSLILPVFGKKTAAASVAEVRAMRDAIDRVLSGAPAPQPQVRIQTSRPIGRR